MNKPNFYHLKYFKYEIKDLSHSHSLQHEYTVKIKLISITTTYCPFVKLSFFLSVKAQETVNYLEENFGMQNNSIN